MQYYAWIIAVRGLLKVKVEIINIVILENKFLIQIIFLNIVCHNTFCIPESFNAKFSHQLFDQKITIVSSQHTNTNYKGDFALKNRF